MAIRILWGLPVLLVAGLAHGQQTSIGQSGQAGQANIEALTKGAAAMLPRGESYGVMGSPYADNRWLPGHLQLASGQPLGPVPVKYDILNHRLLMRPSNHPDSLVLDDRKLVSFELEEPSLGGQAPHRRLFRRFAESPVPTQRSEYVEVVHAGRFELLKRYAKTLRKADYQGAYSTGERYDQIEDKTAYFLLRPDGRLVSLKLGLKPLQAAAPELAAALKTAPGAATARTDAEWAAVLATVDPR